MFFKRSSKKKKSTEKGQKQTEAKQGPRLREGGNDPNVRQGLVYMYAIIGSQLLLLLIIMLVLMFMGKVITTPWWVFAIILAVGFGGCAFAYYRVKRSVRSIKKTIKEMNLGDRNYEITIMGGALRMRVEQNPGRLLEAPSNQQVVDVPAIEAPRQDSGETSDDEAEIVYKNVRYL
ncbi:MAG TPA: hypothetical protein ENO00_04700 [Deltaproteobacteria bacterium]|nr:hypothetical protein [Deltaproteobacteria bacterium]